ncbi:MAG: signal peptidase I [Bdellovibrionaceae bacterium]|nr:signal peptidase I [Pseudobdellovibrionaceae bacterium]
MKRRGSKKASVLGSLGIFLASFLVFLAFRWALVEPFVIPSGSMIPTLLIHDHIFVNKMAYGLRWPFSKKWITEIKTPKRGDVVIFLAVESEDYYMVKRVIGLPGDVIRMDEQGTIFVNDTPLDRKTINALENPNLIDYSEEDLNSDISDIQFINEKMDQKNITVIQDLHALGYEYAPWVVPQKSLFVLGDNRSRSRDSRYWGFMPMDHLVGKALFVWLSCNKTLASASFLCDPSTIRWNRFFHTVN